MTIKILGSFPSWSFRVRSQRAIDFLFLFFWLHHVACGILVPRLGIEPKPSAVRAWSPNHWTAREFPRLFKVGRYPRGHLMEHSPPLPPTISDMFLSWFLLENIQWFLVISSFFLNYSSFGFYDTVSLLFSVTCWFFLFLSFLLNVDFYKAKSSYSEFLL